MQLRSTIKPNTTQHTTAVDLVSESFLTKPNLENMSIIRIMAFLKSPTSWDDTDKSSFNKKDFRIIQITDLSSNLL